MKRPVISISSLLARKLGRSFLAKRPQSFGPVLSALQDYVQVCFQSKPSIQCKVHAFNYRLLGIAGGDGPTGGNGIGQALRLRGQVSRWNNPIDQSYGQRFGSVNGPRSQNQIGGPGRPHQTGRSLGTAIPGKPGGFCSWEPLSSPKWEFSAHIRRSPARASSSPCPRASPLIDIITGIGRVAILLATCNCSIQALRSFNKLPLSCPLNSPSGSWRGESRPTEKALPFPETTTTRTPSLSRMTWQASRISAARAGFIRLPCAGRFKVSLATPLSIPPSRMPS